MDAEKFDALTRTLSRSVHRRRALAGLLAGALGTALGRGASAQLPPLDKPPRGEPCDPGIPGPFSNDCPTCYFCQADQGSATGGSCQPQLGSPCSFDPDPFGNRGSECRVCQQDPDQQPGRPGLLICAPAPGECAIGLLQCSAAGDRNPADPCQACVPAHDQTDWSPLPDGAPCPDDGHPCTVDVCRDGACLHVPRIGGGECFIDGACVPRRATNPGNACQVCDTDQNPNAWSSVEDGAPCDDGDACTQGDECRNGACVGGDPVVCTPSDQCHLAGECDPDTGQCSDPPAENGSPCDDGNACTRNDSCKAGVCEPGESVICEARGQCRAAGTCDEVTGECDNPPAPDGTECDDGDPCTTDDVCVDGECAGTEKPCPGNTECCRRPGNHLGQCVAWQACENSGKPTQRGSDTSAARQGSERGRRSGHGRERDSRRRRKGRGKAGRR